MASGGAYAIRPYCGTSKRIKFRCSYLKKVFAMVASPPCPYLLFLSWYKKRRQKKIKASTEAEEVSRIHVGDRKRTVFLGNTVGAYCIRPTNVPSMERITWKCDAFSDYTIVITWKIDAFHTFTILWMAFGVAYSYCLYLLFFPWWKKRRQKKIKAPTEAEEISRVRVGDRKRTVFSGNKVGAYCIRPTNVPFMERMTRTVDRSQTYTVDELLKLEVAAG